jgi:nucleoside recognition membrane protein YjiH
MNEDTKSPISDKKLKVPLMGYVALFLAIASFSGILALTQGTLSAFDFSTLTGKFGVMQGNASTNFYGAGGVGARDGFLFALTLLPVVMLALGFVEVVEYAGGLKAAQKAMTPLLRPLMGLPGLSTLALITSLQSTDGGAGMTKLLRESGQITEKERNISAAFQFSSAATLTNFLSIGAAAFSIIKVPVIVPLMVIFFCKLLGANLMRLYLAKFYKEDPNHGTKDPA